MVNKYLFILFCIFPAIALSQENDSLRIDYNFINSIPQNADIYLNDIYIGQTPIHFKWDTLREGRKITIKLKGYADITYTPLPEEKTINKTFKLVPFNKGWSKEIVFKDMSSDFKKPVKIIPMVLSSVITAGSAIMAYYFKSLAIDKYEEYQQTGDLATLDKKKKYDVIGGVSLAVFQLGLAALLYFHFIE